jgi:hypothetical protein
MKKNDFMDQYKDPRWQKKRLQIMERDKFTCQSCESEERTLNVHHIRYDSKKKVWEYDDFDLITLCDECHKTWHLIYDNKEIHWEYIYAVVKLCDKLMEEDLGRYFNSDEYKIMEAKILAELKEEKQNGRLD